MSADDYKAIKVAKLRIRFYLLESVKFADENFSFEASQYVDQVIDEMFACIYPLYIPEFSQTLKSRSF